MAEVALLAEELAALGVADAEVDMDDAAEAAAVVVVVVAVVVAVVVVAVLSGATSRSDASSAWSSGLDSCSR